MNIIRGERARRRRFPRVVALLLSAYAVWLPASVSAQWTNSTSNPNDIRNTNPGNVGVGTTALVTAAAGPIGFIALVAPQVARRLTRSPGVSLLASAAMGATILTLAHLRSLLIAQAYRSIPVGLITVCLGGLYLIWLLIREARREYGPRR